MRMLRLIRRPVMGRPDDEMPENESAKETVLDAEEDERYKFQSVPSWDVTHAANASLPRGGKFFRNLSTLAMCEFEAIAERHSCAGAQVLIREGEEPVNTLFLLEGAAKLSINSAEGRRLILGFVGPGEVLGLSSAISGDPYEITGEAQIPCMVASIERQSFVEFLQRHPVACHNVARQFSLEHRRAHRQLRTLALTRSAPAKLARLLLDWSRRDKGSKIGARVRCSFTHGEIGEHIGLSRETVTRCMLDFKGQGLVKRSGSILTISSRDALAVYAGSDQMQDPSKPAA